MRPALSESVGARLHVVRGETVVALHDRRDGRVALIGLREWTILRCADGTRDLPGVVAAAVRLGVAAQEQEVSRWFSELSAAGLLDDGVEAVPRGDREREPFEGTSGRSEPEVVGAATPLPARALVPLPGFGLTCDGQGSCCRIYPTTLFSGLEASRARAFAPEVLDAGEDPSRAFTPSLGSGGLAADAAGRAWAGLAVAMVDGRCAYLDGAGCRVHAAGGAQAKPTGCRLYPASFCDDGREVRVTPAPECACVFRSATSPARGEALVAARTTAELDPAVFVRALPTTVTLAPGRRASRAEYLAWCDDRARELDAMRHPDAVLDGARVLLGWSAELVGDDAEAGASRTALDDALAALGSRARRRAVLHRGWRAEADLARCVPGWIELAVEAIRRGEERPASEDEAFYLRALAHGHLWLDEERPLVDSLRERACRVLVARALVDVARRSGSSDPALDHPLALVEAVGRWL